VALDHQAPPQNRPPPGARHHENHRPTIASRPQIRRDLLLEKTPAFSRSPLYTRVFALADKAGKPMPRQAMPQIDLKSPKITRKLTTEWFARRVEGRYKTCLGRGNGR
jgi:hypothetical protein